MIQVVVENFTVAGVGLALLFYLGGGLSLWLPRALVPFRWWVAPWAGYCLLVVVTQFLTNSPFSLTALQSAFVALGLATIVNMLAAWSTLHAASISDVPPAPDCRPLILIAMGVFVLCLLPLWSYGYSTVIGENWDAEIYLGLGEYLKVYPQSGLALAAPNPILDTLVNPPYGLRTHGFSYFQAALGFLPLDSLHTLAPVLALLRALSIPAAYVFFRAGLRFGSRAALLASAALGLNAFLLWVTYNMFGMQVPTFGLLPLVLCFTLVMFDQVGGGRGLGPEAARAAAWTGLFAAAVAVTYHPALTAYVAMAGPPLVVMLVRHWRTAGWRVLVSVGLAAAVGVLLSLVSQLKSIDGFLKQYSEKTGGLGLTGFTSPADAFGFSLSFRELLPAGTGRPVLSLLSMLYGLAGWPALLVCAALIALYVFRLWSSSRALSKRDLAWQQTALLVGTIAYPLLFLRPLDYPYGWFKALSFVSFVLVGFAVAGLADFVLLPPRIRAAKLKIQYSTGLALLALVLITSALTVRMYWGQPLRFNREMLEVGAVRDVILGAQGEKSVYLSNSPEMQRLGVLYNGLLSYYLRDTDLYGDFKTANSALNRERPDGLYRYLLLNAGDSPSEYGAAGAQPAWHNSLMSLYASPQGDAQHSDLYHHNYRNDREYPDLDKDHPLYLTVEAGKVSASGTPPPGNSPIFPDSPSSGRQLSLGLAAFTTSTLRIEAPGMPATSTVELVVPPGYTAYSSPLLSTPRYLKLSLPGAGAGTDRIYIRWAHLEEYAGVAGKAAGLASDGIGLLAGVSASREGESINLSVVYLNNRPKAVSQTLSLDIYGEGRGNSAHYGYWNFAVPPASPLDLNLALDAARKSLTLGPRSPATQTASFTGPTGDGSYTASLLVYENGQVSESFNDIFKFEIRAGKVASFTPRSLPPQFR